MPPFDRHIASPDPIHGIGITKYHDTTPLIALWSRTVGKAGTVVPPSFILTFPEYFKRGWLSPKKPQCRDEKRRTYAAKHRVSLWTAADLPPLSCGQAHPFWHFVFVEPGPGHNRRSTRCVFSFRKTAQNVRGCERRYSMTRQFASFHQEFPKHIFPRAVIGWGQRQSGG